jgi:hypothetical protein
MTEERKELNNLASNKAFAKVTMLQINIDDIKDDLKHQLYGAISKEELEDCLRCTQKELKIWRYIYNLLEQQEL